MSNVIYFVSDDNFQLNYYGYHELLLNIMSFFFLSLALLSIVICLRELMKSAKSVLILGL